MLKTCFLDCLFVGLCSPLLEEERSGVAEGVLAAPFLAM